MTGGPVRIGVDTGGTFTDLVCLRNGRLEVHKVPSTPDDPSRAIALGLARWADGLAGAEVVHGSTVGTNALLERKGAIVALLATAGFEDVLAIGRQDRPALYDLGVSREEPLVPEERRLGVRERTLFDGSVLAPLAPAEVERAVERLRSIPGLESVAISLLHSYANPEHERRLAEAAAPLGLHLSVSSEILPEHREYERTATTVANAYLGPVMDRYLSRLAAAVPVRRLWVMHSGGGLLSVEAAGRYAARTALSGPAGGVLGGAAAARAAGFAGAITFDMGGTSTDASLVRGGPSTTTEAVVAGLPIRFPMLDVHTVGAGGGSIASLDAGGALRVGPESAGAVPGPMCYGRGGARPTVTDANLYLGRLVPDRFLGGRMRLDPDAARLGIEALATEAGIEAERLARGILAVACARMERAIRAISVERGHDPRDFCLVAFGGAGPMHACELAGALAIPVVLVPPEPGALSARGMLAADVVKDYSRSWLGRTRDADPRELETSFQEMEDRARREMAADGVGPERLVVERSLDLRYEGQSYELSVPAGPDAPGRFHALHRERYGHAHEGWETELVLLRVRAVGRTLFPEPVPESEGSSDSSGARLGSCRAVFKEPADAVLYDREGLRPGHRFQGPAIVVEMSATTVVPPGWTARVDRFRNLVLEPR
ncbi:MAG: hydantoinase/oxoprolinase family protein [Planctomycetes bacterium]|nr:hydantoinase/oxoprolinase family protein [Planctomycetota bacterium]